MVMMSHKFTLRIFWLISRICAHIRKWPSSEISNSFQKFQYGTVPFYGISLHKRNTSKGLWYVSDKIQYFFNMVFIDVLL